MSSGLRHCGPPAARRSRPAGGVRFSGGLKLPGVKPVAALKGAAAFGCALLCCACAAAQASSWVVVRGFAPGSHVEARLADGATVEGKFLSASASGMELQTSHGVARYLPSERITRIYLIGKSTAGRDAWVGFAAGAAAGAVYGVARANCYPSGSIYPNPSCEQLQEHGLAWAPLFGLIGAVIGDVAGALHPPRVLVYRRGFGPDHRKKKASRRQKPVATSPQSEPAGSAGPGAG